MGCHPSHWRTHIFQDGYCTTNQMVMRRHVSPCCWLCASPCWRVPRCWCIWRMSLGTNAKGWGPGRRHFCAFSFNKIRNRGWACMLVNWPLTSVEDSSCCLAPHFQLSAASLVVTPILSVVSMATLPSAPVEVRGLSWGGEWRCWSLKAFLESHLPDTQTLGFHVGGMQTCFWWIGYKSKVGSQKWMVRTSKHVKN